MGVKVKTVYGENIISLMRRFKRLCERDNVIREYKKHCEYEKPSQKKRRAHFRRLKNMEKYEEERKNPKKYEEETTTRS